MSVKKQSHTIFHYLVMVAFYFIKNLAAEFIWLLIGIGGYFIFRDAASPYNILVGIPVVFVSLGFVCNSIGSQLLAVFSPNFNRGVCILCRKTI